MPTIFRDPVRVTNLATGEILDLQTSQLITDVLDGWNNTAPVDAPLVGRGGGAGSRRGSRWVDKDRYLTLGGAAYADAGRDASEALRDTLFGFFRPSNDLAIDRQMGSTWRRMFVSVYDAITCQDPIEDGFRYTIPLIAMDPVKYGVDREQAEAGAFAGDKWYRVYDESIKGRRYIVMDTTPPTVGDTVTYTNLVPTPRPEITQGWTSTQTVGASTVSLTPTVDQVNKPTVNDGPGSRRVVATVAGVNSSIKITQPSTARAVLQTLNQTFQARIGVYWDVAAGADNNTVPTDAGDPDTTAPPTVPGGSAVDADPPAPRTVKLNVLRYDSAGALLGTMTAIAQMELEASGWQVLSEVVTPGPGTASVTLQVDFEGQDVGDQYFVSEPVVAPAGTGFVPVSRYFDGDTGITGSVWHKWVGTRGSSASQEYVPGRELPGRWGQRYVQPGEGARASAAFITNAGNAVSRRVLITIYGPLPPGDWELVNETTGDSLFIDQSLVNATTPLIIDSFDESVFFGGNDISSLMYGDWIRLAPGANTLRLLTGAVSQAAYMVVEAYSSWR